MLEFKNTSVSLAGGLGSKPFSLIANSGDVVCICGPAGSGKTRLLKAVLGLAPVESGFITLDGELITSGSGAYFRRMTSYVPQDMPRDHIRVGELLEMIADSLGTDAETAHKELLGQWEWWGIDGKTMDASLDGLSRQELSRVLLSMVPLQKRMIVLLDDVEQSQKAAAFIRRLADGGAEVFYSCRDSNMGYDKLVSL